jgi:rhodanese-related sulfurtransferase
MRSIYKNSVSIAIAVAVVLLAPFATVYGKDVSLITKEELRKIMSSENLVILDVRTGRDWSSSEFKIKGAARVDPKAIAQWQENYSKDKQFVLYCA